MTRVMSQPPADAFPLQTRRFLQTVDTSVLADDAMYLADDATSDERDDHYLTCGASALNAVMAVLSLAERPDPGTLLDFGSGAGRVTRWLRAAYPSSQIDCCDLRPADLDFCRDRFGAETWVSGIDIAALSAPRRYDLIWVGSVLTHLSEPRCRELIEKLLSWTNPGGVVVASIIGRAARTTQERGSPYIHPDGWRSMQQQLAVADFAYSDYADAVGYGLSLAKPSWSARLLEGMSKARLVLFAEQVWDATQDLLAIQNNDSFEGLPAQKDPRQAETDALKARIAALEASTSWRITAPLRRAAGLFRSS